jgi:hypothetical protein
LEFPVNHHPASFRDPSGFVFFKDSKIYRQVNRSYQPDFDHLISSGLFNRLVEKGMLITHKQLSENLTGDDYWYTTLLPEQLSYISYPYEWCFDMLKDAALVTLQTNRQAIEQGMILKDASAFNLQLHNGKMLLIDSLSFENYDQKQPWVAYRQFCEHFLAPLAFMHYQQQPAQSVLTGKIEGLPLGIVKKLLPFRSKWNLNIYLHLHLHASLSNKKNKQQKTAEFSVTKMKQLLSSLESAVASLNFSEKRTIWSEYYEEAAQRDAYLNNKKTIIDTWIKKLSILSALDVGSNEGEFSEMLAARNIYAISIDGDHHAINKLYNRIKRGKFKNIQPLVIDITNPSPSIGWNNKERASFLDRTNTDLVLALAVIHHLVIGKNIPLEKISSLFSMLGNKLIIEFVPKDDEKVQLMLQHRKDVFEDYTEENFLKIFSGRYKVLDQQNISTSKRTLYLMERI